MEGDWRAVTGNEYHPAASYLFLMFLPSPCFLFTSLSQLSWPQLAYKDRDAWTNYPKWSNKKNWTLKRSESWSISRPADGDFVQISLFRPPPIVIEQFELENDSNSAEKIIGLVGRGSGKSFHECWILFHALSTCQPLSTRLSAPFPRVYENLIKFDQTLRTKRFWPRHCRSFEGTDPSAKQIPTGADGAALGL